MQTWLKQARTIELRGPQLPEAIDYDLLGKEITKPLLTVRSVRGREAVGELYRYTVRAQVEAPENLVNPDDANQIALGPIIRSWATIEIQGTGIGTPEIGAPGASGLANIGADTRYINGNIISASFVGVDNRAAIYEFVIAPFVWEATLNRDRRVFLNKTVIEVIEEVIGGYWGTLEMRIAGPWGGVGYYPKRDYIRQEDESDWNFAMRLMEEWGLFFWFEHSAQHHSLVISDTMGGFRKHGIAYETLRYHTGSRIDEEHIAELRVQHQPTVEKVTVNDHSYMHPRLRKSNAPNHETYEDHNSERQEKTEIYARAEFTQPSMHREQTPDEISQEGQHLARVKLEAELCTAIRAHGTGHLSALQSGRTFKLAEYPHADTNTEYVVLSVELYMTEIGASSGAVRNYEVKTSFELMPTKLYYRLPQVTPRPRIHGHELAVIVAPQENEMWGDYRNCLLIQFEWDRHGDYEGKTSILVRTASPWQGNEMGVVAPGRAGQMVIVTHVNGDPDKPLITAFVVDVNNMPPFELPHNRALYGTRVKSLEYGNQSAHCVLDATAEKLQAQLASDHGYSLLVLGYITLINGVLGRQNERGEGFELRTDLVGALRAALGLFATTYGRPLASGRATEMGELLALINAALDLHENAAREAQHHGAQATGEDQSDVSAEISDANARLKGTRTKDFPEFSDPDIALASAANLHATAEKNTHIASGRNTAVTAGGHISLAAAKSLYASVHEKLSLYSTESMKHVSRGPVSVQSKTDEIEMIARRAVKILSETDELHLRAKVIILNADGTEMRMDASGFHGRTSGGYVMHAATQGALGPQSGPSHHAAIAPYPYEISCGALAANEVYHVPNAAKSVASGSPTPAPAPTPALSAAPAPSAADMLPAASSGGSGTLVPINTGTQTPAKPPGKAPAEPEGEPCKSAPPDVPMAQITMDMETGNYWGRLRDGSKYTDARGDQIYVRVAGSEGTFDIGYDKATNTITQRVIVFVRAMQVRVADATPGAVPNIVPYETVRDSRAENAAKYIKETRPASEITGLIEMKERIEDFLNSAGFKLSPLRCPYSQPGKNNSKDVPVGTQSVPQRPCEQQINIKFVIDFVTDKKERHHREVNLYKQAQRADSGNWGETCVRFDDEKKVWTPLKIEHVQAHETGHLFSFPDEYFDSGGAIHKSYIDNEQVKVELALNNPDKNAWQGDSMTTLMGPGIFTKGVKVPSYYLERTAQWFERQNGRKWAVVPHIEA